MKNSPELLLHRFGEWIDIAGSIVSVAIGAAAWAWLIFAPGWTTVAICAALGFAVGRLNR